jgi:hypothetical protein
MNLLPSFKTLNVTKEDKSTNWNPKASIPSNKDLSYLGVKNDWPKTETQSNVIYNVRPILPPNERYSINDQYNASNPSPLADVDR